MKLGFLSISKLVRSLTVITLFSSMAFVGSASANRLDDYLALLKKEGNNHLLQIDYGRSNCRTYLNPFGKYKDGIVETTVLVGDLGISGGTACRGFANLYRVTMNCNSGKLIYFISDESGYREIEMEKGASKLAAFALCLPKEVLSQSGKLDEADNLMRNSSEAIYAGTVEEKRSALEKLKRAQEIYGKFGNVGWRKGRNLAYLCDGYSLMGDWGNAQTFCQQLGDWGKESAITKHMIAKSLLMLASAYLGGGKLEETVKTLEQIRSFDIKSECDSGENVECKFYIPLLSESYGDNNVDQVLLEFIGDTYFYFREYKKAIEYYNKVKNTFPQEKQRWQFASDCNGEGGYPKRKVYPKIGLAMLRDGNLSEALKDLNEFCLGKSPRKDLEELYMSQGKYKEAFDVSKIGVGRYDGTNTNFFKSVSFIEETNSQKALRLAKNENATLILYSYGQDYPPNELVRDLSIARDRKLFIYVVKPTGSIEARTVDIQKFSTEVAKQVPIPVSQGNNLVASIVLIAIAGGVAFYYRETKQVLIITGIITLGALSVLAVISGQSQPRGEVTTKNLSLTSLLRSAQISIQDDKSLNTSGLENTSGCSQNGECLNYLYQVLIQPVGDILPKPNERIIFIPDKDIFTTPFAALKDSSGKYLIENHPISIAPSIYLLDELYRYSNSIWRPTATEPAVVVGNPVMPPVKISWGGAPISLASLPGTESEAREVSKLYNVIPLIGKEATKITVTEKLKSAKILHFATHGFPKARVNRELRYREICYDGFGFYRECSVYDEGQGALAFTASNGNDGILSEVELQDRRVAAELVVLSACKTSLNSLSNSKSFYSGSTGMASPFLTAGVPSVVASLWFVPDASTSELMVEFYKNLKNTPDRSQALQLAQITIMKKYPNPLNWAGFQLIGLSKNPPRAEVSAEQVFQSVAYTVKAYLESRNEGYLPRVGGTKKHRKELESMFLNERIYSAQIPGIEKRLNDFKFDFIPNSLKFIDFDNAEIDVIIYSKKFHIVLKGSEMGWSVDSISGVGENENVTPNVSSQCQTVTLVAREANTQINIREGAGQQYTALNYGVPGDVVNLLGTQNDTQGSTWYQVYFPKSKVKGWVKGDFVKANC